MKIFQILFPFVMTFLIVLLLFTTTKWQQEEWRHGNWDFDDFPYLCKRKLKQTDEALAFANTPHFGGTPNNSQVWM